MSLKACRFCGLGYEQKKANHVYCSWRCTVMGRKQKEQQKEDKQRKRKAGQLTNWMNQNPPPLKASRNAGKPKDAQSAPLHWPVVNEPQGDPRNLQAEEEAVGWLTGQWEKKQQQQKQLQQEAIAMAKLHRAGQLLKQCSMLLTNVQAFLRELEEGC